MYKYSYIHSCAHTHTHTHTITHTYTQTHTHTHTHTHTGLERGPTDRTATLRLAHGRTLGEIVSRLSDASAGVL